MNVDIDTILRMYGELAIQKSVLEAELARCTCGAEEPHEFTALSKEEASKLKDILDE